MILFCNSYKENFNIKGKSANLGQKLFFSNNFWCGYKNAEFDAEFDFCIQNWKVKKYIIPQFTCSQIFVGFLLQLFQHIWNQHKILLFSHPYQNYLNTNFCQLWSLTRTKRVKKYEKSFFRMWIKLPLILWAYLSLSGHSFLLQMFTMNLPTQVRPLVMGHLKKNRIWIILYKRQRYLKTLGSSF